jgi:DNA-binding phage protein
MAKKTAHDVVLDALVSDRTEFEKKVDALIERNRARRAYVIAMINETLIERNISKAELAQRAGLNEAAVRRLLTAEDQNPTLETVLRLLAVLGIDLEAVLPSGEHMALTA